MSGDDLTVDRVVLDTHALVWWVSGSSELSDPAVTAIERTGDVRVSLVSLWEAAIKEGTRHPMIGSDDVGEWFRAALDATGFATIGIEASHLAAVQHLPPVHGDPFDRLLVAQARALDAAIVTRDRRLAEYDVTTIR